MKKSVVIALCLFCFVAAVPVPEDRPKSIELLKIPLKGDKELDILTVGADSGTVRERNKRTIGVLRELFPNLSKIIEQKIQGIVQVLFRTVGPLLLRGGIGGGGGTTTSSSLDDDFDDDDDDDDSATGSAGNGGRRVNVSLPTFAPFDDSDEDTAGSSSNTIGDTAAKASEPSRISLLSGADSFGSNTASSTQASESNSIV